MLMSRRTKNNNILYFLLEVEQSKTKTHTYILHSNIEQMCACNAAIDSITQTPNDEEAA